MYVAGNGPSYPSRVLLRPPVHLEDGIFKLLISLRKGDFVFSTLYYFCSCLKKVVLRNWSEAWKVTSQKTLNLKSVKKK